MALRQRAGTEDKLRPYTSTHPPLFFFFYHIFLFILAMSTLWCPCGLLLSPHTSPCRLPHSPPPPCCLSKQDLSHVVPPSDTAKATQRLQPPSPPPLPLSSLLLRGATEPCPPITPGALGLQCSPRGPAAVN